MGTPKHWIVVGVRDMPTLIQLKNAAPGEQPAAGGTQQPVLAPTDFQRNKKYF